MKWYVIIKEARTSDRTQEELDRFASLQTAHVHMNSLQATDKRNHYFIRPQEEIDK